MRRKATFARLQGFCGMRTVIVGEAKEAEDSLLTGLGGLVPE